MELIPFPTKLHLSQNSDNNKKGCFELCAWNSKVTFKQKVPSCPLTGRIRPYFPTLKNVTNA